MDMQRQRVDQHLPRSMKLILDLAGLRTEIQEAMAAKVWDGDGIYGLLFFVSEAYFYYYFYYNYPEFRFLLCTLFTSTLLRPHTSI